MIEGLKPYPEYKNSSVSWLGDIPSSWEVRRMKLLLRELDHAHQPARNSCCAFRSTRA